MFAVCAAASCRNSRSLSAAGGQTVGDRLVPRRLSAGRRLAARRLSAGRRLAARRLSADRRLVARRLSAGCRLAARRLPAGRRLVTRRLSAGRRLAVRRLPAGRRLAADSDLRCAGYTSSPASAFACSSGVIFVTVTPTAARARVESIIA